MTALVVVGGLVAAPAQTGVALAEGKAEVSVPSPIRALQDAVRGDDQGTSRDAERTALAASATQISASTERRVAAKEKQQRAIAAQQKVMKQKADAARKKKIAQQKARIARIKKLGYEPGTTDPRSMARQILKNKYGYGSDQFACFNNIIMRESMWNVHATNAGSGAYGIPQALPGGKMASVASDWRTNPATQIIWGIQYMKSTYGSPCAAWGFKSSHGWY
ncbi:MAG TPA: transglycosylase SLT domain-containing protein [Microlunatus sp.]|nr:transglycosylase SLT domain-containing protein [Microlunatus sp.]